MNSKLQITAKGRSIHRRYHDAAAQRMKEIRIRCGYGGSMKYLLPMLVGAALAGCAPSVNRRLTDGSVVVVDPPDLLEPTAPDSGTVPPPPQDGCGELMGCYTVFAHSDHTLYRVDL